MTIVVMRSGGLGLFGWVGRRTANALAAKIDNAISAITRDLFAFMKNARPAPVDFYKASGGFSDAAKGEIGTPPLELKRPGLDSIVAGA